MEDELSATAHDISGRIFQAANDGQEDEAEAIAAGGVAFLARHANGTDFHSLAHRALVEDRTPQRVAEAVRQWAIFRDQGLVPALGSPPDDLHATVTPEVVAKIEATVGRLQRDLDSAGIPEDDVSEAEHQLIVVSAEIREERPNQGIIVAAAARFYAVLQRGQCSMAYLGVALSLYQIVATS